MKIAAKKIESVRAKEKLFNFRPVFFAAIFLCAGVLFGYGTVCFSLSPLWCIMIFPMAVGSICLRGKAVLRESICVWCVLSACFLFGMLTFSAQISDFQSVTAYNREADVYGRVVGLIEYDGYYALELDDLTIEGNRESGRLNAYLPASFCQNLRFSDNVFIHGVLSTDTSLFDEYGFRAKDIRLGRYYKMSSVSALTVTGHTFDLFATVRERMRNALYTGMEEDSAAVAFAVLTGDTSGIETRLFENVRAGGVAHVFAVSGLHIGSLFAFCTACMKRTRLRKLPKGAKFAITASVVLFYVGVCGFTASSVRAAVVCLTGYAAKLLGIKKDFLQSLGLSAILLVAFAPVALFEVGFQLSFAACLGLEWFLLPLKNMFACLYAQTRNLFGVKNSSDENAPPSVFRKCLRAATSALCVSLSAQIATMPILLQRFGFVSGWSLLLNVFFVPIVSGAFSFLLALTALASVLPSVCQTVLLHVPSVVWQGLLLVFEAFDFSTFALTTPFSVGSTVAYYGGCLFATDKWNIERRMKICLSSACFLVFVVTVVASNT